MEQSKVAETRGWQMSADDLKEGIKGLEDGGLSVQTPSKELMDGLHKVGEEILENWKKQADSNALAILKKYQDSL